MDPQTAQAIGFARDLATQLLSLSTGILAFSAAFAQQVLARAPDASRVVKWMWVLYLGSIVCGIWTLMALTGAVADEAFGTAGPDLIYRTSIRLPSLLQVTLFLLATGSLIAYGFRAASARPGSESQPEP